ncbi:unnamed protein product [Rhodiola kirilowii]
MTPRLAYYKILSLLSDFHSNSSALIADIVSNSLEWIRPPPNYVKINCDASLNVEEGKGAIAAWVQDSHALTMATRCRPVTGCTDVPDAEGQPLRLGMELANELHLQNVIFESDCSEVVASINKKLYPSHWSQQWFNRCCRFLSQQLKWKVQLVRREANGLVDALAKKSRVFDLHWTRLDAVPLL